MIRLFIDKLADWITDWSVEQFNETVDGLIGYRLLTDWSIDRLIVLIGSRLLTDWSIDRLTVLIGSRLLTD